MPNRRRKGKPHRPFTPANPLDFLRPADPEERKAVLLRFGAALHMMAVHREPTRDEWRDLADMVNTVEALVDMGKLIPGEVMPSVKQASDAMIDALRRHHRGQRLGVSGPGLEALRDCLAIYTQCAEGLTVIEMSAARRLVEQKVRYAIRTKHPGVVSA